MFRLTEVVKNLLIINVIIFIATLTLQSSWPDVVQLGKLHYFKLNDFYPHQFVTSLFMHGGFEHLLLNMLGLVIFGPEVERILGPKRFLILYMLAGLGGSLLSMGIDVFQYYRTGEIIYKTSLGASGCIYGVVIAYITMFPNRTLILFPIPIPIKAMYLGLGLIGIALFYGITDFGAGDIGHFAHLGGALIGYIMIRYWKMANLR